MIFEGKPRESGCPYQSEALGLDSRGNLLFCSPKSPDLGSCLENSALAICAENQPKREAIIQSYCNYCIHDYHAAPSKESLEEHAQEGLLRNCMSVRQSIINANKIPSALPEALEWSKYNKALIIGWYGTETIGDKAIIGELYEAFEKAGVGYHADKYKYAVAGVVFFGVGFYVLKFDGLDLILAFYCSCDGFVFNNEIRVRLVRFSQQLLGKYL